MDQSTFVRVTEAWRHLSKVPAAFREPGETVVGVADGSLICPPGWCGYVRIGDRAVMVAPDAERSARLSLETFRSAAVGDRLGPAVLAFLDRPLNAPTVAVTSVDTSVVEVVTAEDPRLADFELAVGADDADEAGISNNESPVFVAFDGSRIAAASGYRTWVGRLAHIGVLTHTDYRGRGLAKIVSAAATAHARAAGLIPQWRARTDNAPSRAVAVALGFTEIGEQISVRIASGAERS